jgi:hypothetical protein
MTINRRPQPSSRPRCPRHPPRLPSVRRWQRAPRPRRPRALVAIGCAVALGCLAAAAPAAARVLLEAPAQVSTQQASAQPSIQQGATQPGGPQAPSPERTGASLESAASRAGNTARTVAMSLIGLALAIASIVLAFRRDFKEAAGVFAVGIVAVLLATPAGLSLLRDTVTSLFGS